MGLYKNVNRIALHLLIDKDEFTHMALLLKNEIKFVIVNNENKKKFFFPKLINYGWQRVIE